MPGFGPHKNVAPAIQDRLSELTKTRPAAAARFRREAQACAIGGNALVSSSDDGGHRFNPCRTRHGHCRDGRGESGQSQRRGTYELTSTFSGRGGISPRSTRRTWRVIISLVGAGTPALAPSMAMKPFISSISVRRPFAMSCAIDGR